jgi:hypothetical protein
MIFQTSSLGFLLLTGQAAALSSKTFGRREGEALHGKHMQNLIKTLSKGEVVIRTDATNLRKLADNTAYLAYEYFNDGSSCSAAPYATSGTGMGACIKDVNGADSYILTCSGDQTAISIGMDTYTNVTDCSNTAVTTTSTVDGSCGLDAYDIDDRVADDQIDTAAAYTLTCSTEQGSSTVVFNYWESSDCDGLLSAYVGLNTGTCIPLADGTSITRTCKHLNCLVSCILYIYLFCIVSLSCLHFLQYVYYIYVI